MLTESNGIASNDTVNVVGADGLIAPGVVYLVGAGPGAVGLLTVRAVQVICNADAVLHDRLVPSEVVALAKQSAEVRYVGKDGDVSTDKMKGQQDSISAQLVALAQRGLSVCRLKGGDPMIFGRAGEEMEELAAAGVPYEVVPGVTAALAAAADARIPLTFRNVSMALRVHTMNPTTTRDPNFDWSQFAAASTTYALYMGLSALQSVCEKMIAAGVPGPTPMAVVDRASLAAMQVVAGTVATLPGLVAGRVGLEGPALVLLGDVVALRDRLISKPSPPPGSSGAKHATVLVALPQLSDAELVAARARIDELLARRSETLPMATEDASFPNSLKRPAAE